MHIALKSKKLTTDQKITTLDFLVDSAANPKLRDALGKSLWDCKERERDDTIEEYLKEFFGGETGCGDPTCTNCG
jgi:hypothetical protein